MSISKEEVQDLAYKWKNNTITPEEKKKLDEWYQQYPSKKLIWTKDSDEEALKKRLLQNILSKKGGYAGQFRKKPASIAVYKYAAAALVVVAFGIWFLIGNQDVDNQNTVVAHSVIDIEPGRQTATLVLGNGEEMQLDTISNGVISTHDKVAITKTGAAIDYHEKQFGEDKKEQICYNTIYTNRGNQFQIILADGTKVWLNSESSIRYPTQFNGNTREVELTGEAYFEVVKNKQQPFYVNVKGIEVEVLGTHFNVNAYADEPFIKTTLVEGSVKVNREDYSVLISPGEQAMAANSETGIKVLKVDVQQVLAWQQGFFEFTNISLPEITRQIGRWYNVDIKLEDGKYNERFGGRISKNLNLEKVLELLRTSGIEFEMKEDRVLVVKPAKNKEGQQS